LSTINTIFAHLFYRLIFCLMYKFITALAFIFLSINLSSQIVFVPQWYPQAQFAGYYVAREKGFYEELNLDVKITHPVSSQNALDYLVKNEADIISLFLVSGLSAYSQGADIINIGQLSQTSSLLFVAKEDRQILNIKDFNDKKIGIWKSGFDELPRIFMKNYNLDVDWVLLTSSVNLFLMDGVDILTVTYYNEYDQIINSGINEDELTRFFLNEYGYDVPEDGLYCKKSTLKNKKEDIEKFYLASFKGWKYAKENPEEALKIVLKVMEEERLASNFAHQKWMLEKMLELIVPDDKTSYGKLSQESFQHTYEILKSAGYINSDIKYEEFYQSPIK
ncbi:ABC transporter substrate-binding protein, partial [Bacteroidales bacterium OttesenSCG-928-K03]|nr:ABC transporter substrate-binding protein [Bacteroidales bacterium OttesenSCG-928-K03]